MKAGRKKDPRAGYVMHKHKNGEYYYAYTSKPCVNKDGKRFYFRTQWGRLDSSLQFKPFVTFSSLPPEEKEKFIFPKDWDLSQLDYRSPQVLPPKAQGKNGETPSPTVHDTPKESKTHSSVRASVGALEEAEGASEGLETSEAPSNISGGSDSPSKGVMTDVTFSIGATWLVLEWADRIGLTKDLLEAFHGNQEKVDNLMTLVIYCLISNYTFSYVQYEQAITKLPTNRILYPAEVTKFFSGITSEEMSTFFSLWANRYEGDTCGFDSTSISSYSKLLYDVKNGYNKDGDDLPQINFVIVYSLTSGVPIYYEEYAGNHPDCRGLLVALRILWDFGFRDFVLVTDRGYDTIENIESLAWEGQKVLTAAKTSNTEVINIINEIKIENYYPSGMEWEGSIDAFYKQVRMDLVLAKDGETRSIDYRINLYYSPEKAFDETKRAFDKLKDMKSRVRESIQNHEKEDKETFSKSNNLLDIEYTEEGYVKSFTVNEEKWKKKLSLCGYYASKTLGLDINPVAAHIKYKFRDEHEKDFYILKDTLKMSRLRSYTEQSKNGRVFTLFIALIIASSLRRELRYNPVLGSKFHNETELLKCMMSLKATYHEDKLVQYHPFVGMHNVIANNLGLEIPEGCGKGYKSIQPTRTGKRGRPRKVKVVTLES